MMFFYGIDTFFTGNRNVDGDVADIDYGMIQEILFEMRSIVSRADSNSALSTSNMLIR